LPPRFDTTFKELYFSEPRFEAIDKYLFKTLENVSVDPFFQVKDPLVNALSPLSVTSVQSPKDP
jgi:hypothetical protein